MTRIRSPKGVYYASPGQRPGKSSSKIRALKGRPNEPPFYPKISCTTLPPPVIDLDEAHAGLGETEGEQTPSPEV